MKQTALTAPGGLFEAVSETSLERGGKLLRLARPVVRREFANDLPARIEGDLVDGKCIEGLQKLIHKIEKAAEELGRGTSRHSIFEACSQATNVLNGRKPTVVALLEGAPPAPMLATIDLNTDRTHQEPDRGHRPNEETCETVRRALGTCLPNELTGKLELLRFLVDYDRVQQDSWMLAGAIRVVASVMPDEWETWLEKLGARGRPVGATGRLTDQGEVLCVDSIESKLEAFAKDHRESLCVLPADTFGGEAELSVPESLEGRVVLVSSLEQLVFQILLAAEGRELPGAATAKIQIDRGDQRLDCRRRPRRLDETSLLPLVLTKTAAPKAVEHEEPDARDFPHDNDQSRTATEFAEQVATELAGLEAPSRSLLLGPPGMGKSFTLAQVHGYILRSGRRLCLHVSSGDLKVALRSHPGQRLSIEHINSVPEWRTLQTRRGREQCVLCVDGLDELSPEDFNATCTLMEHWPGPVVATGRPHVAGRERLSGFAKWELQLPKDSDLEQYLRGNENEEIAARIVEHRQAPGHICAQLATTPLGLEMLLQAPGLVHGDRWPKLERFEQLIGERVHSVRARSSHRLPDSAWNWWRFRGASTLGRAALEMLRGDETAVDVAQLAPLVDGALGAVMCFLDSGALTEPADDHSWVFAHQVFAEALAARSLAEAPIGRQIDTIAAAVRGAPGKFDHVLELAAPAMSNITPLVTQLLAEDNRPLHALRLGLLLAARARLEDEQVAVELALRARQWLPIHRRARDTPEANSLLPKKQDIWAFVELQRPHLYQNWQTLIAPSVTDDVPISELEDEELVVLALRSPSYPAGQLLQRLRPDLPLTLRLRIDPNWYFESDPEALEVLSARFIEEPCFDREWKASATAETGYFELHRERHIRSTIRAWLDLADDEECLRWLPHLPMMTSHANDYFADTWDCINPILEAVLRSGELLQRWQALHSVVTEFSRRTAGSPRQPLTDWPPVHSCVEAEDRFIKFAQRAWKRRGREDNARRDRTYDLLEQLLDSVIDETSSDILQHAWLMRRVGLTHGRSESEKLEMSSETKPPAQAQVPPFPGARQLLEEITSERPEDTLPPEFDRFLEANLTSGSGPLRVQALVLLGACGYPLPKLYIDDLCRSRDDCERWIGHFLVIVDRRRDRGPCPDSLLSELPASLRHFEEPLEQPIIESSLIASWGATARQFISDWLMRHDVDPELLSTAELTRVQQDDIATVWRPFRYSARYYKNQERKKNVSVDTEPSLPVGYSPQHDAAAREDHTDVLEGALLALNRQGLYEAFSKLPELGRMEEPADYSRKAIEPLLDALNLEGLDSWEECPAKVFLRLLETPRFQAVDEGLVEELADRLSKVESLDAFAVVFSDWPGFRLVATTPRRTRHRHLRDLLADLLEEHVECVRTLAATADASSLSAALRELWRSQALRSAKAKSQLDQMSAIIMERLLVTDPLRVLEHEYAIRTQRILERMPFTEQREAREALVQLWERRADFEPEEVQFVVESLQWLMAPARLQSLLRDGDVTELEPAVTELHPAEHHSFLAELLSQADWSTETRAEVAHGLIRTLPTSGPNVRQGLEDAVVWAHQGLVDLRNARGTIDACLDSIAPAALSRRTCELLSEMFEDEAPKKRLQALLVWTASSDIQDFAIRVQAGNHLPFRRLGTPPVEKLFNLLLEYAPAVEGGPPLWDISDARHVSDPVVSCFLFAFALLLQLDDGTWTQRLLHELNARPPAVSWLACEFGRRPEHVKFTWELLDWSEQGKLADCLARCTTGDASSWNELVRYGITRVGTKERPEQAYEMHRLLKFLALADTELSAETWRHIGTWLDEADCDVLGDRMFWILMSALHERGPSRCEHQLARLTRRDPRDLLPLF